MGIFHRFFRENSHAADNIHSAQKVVQEYANFLNTSAPLPGCVADTSELPHRKALIKASLSACINATGDPGLIEHFKNGYLMLSAWQEGVGDKVLGVDFTRMNLEEDPIDIAEQVQYQNDQVEHWTPVVVREQKILAAELLSLGV
jgi:hypothetical protein